MESALLLTAEAFAPYVDRWRRDSWMDTDPPIRLADAVPPHITMLWPWHPDPMSDQPLSRLRTALAGLTAFSLRFRTVGVFDDGPVFLDPDPSPDLERLLAVLVEAFPEYPPYGGQFETVHLHLTVADHGGDELAAEVRAARLDLTLPVDNIAVWQVSNPAHAGIATRVPLGRPGA